jgi:FkbM family methyltransferase
MDTPAVMEAVVRSAYRAILRREPEPQVLAAQANEAAPDLDHDIQSMMQAFLDSAEYRSLLIQAQIPEFYAGSWVIAELQSRLKLWVDLGDYGVSRQCLTETYEPVETAFLARAIRPGMTFVDIGANIGWFALHAAQWVEDAGRVIAFEPRGDLYERLSLSAKINGFEGRIETHNVALGAEPGVAALGCDTSARNNLGGTWLLTNPEIRERFEAVGAVVQETPVATLDQLIAGRAVDFIKIDIEGAEPLAMRGAMRTLRSSRPTILSEVNYLVLPEVSGVSGLEYMAMMADLGYEAHRIEGDEVGERVAPETPPPEGGVANYVFMAR